MAALGPHGCTLSADAGRAAVATGLKAEAVTDAVKAGLDAVTATRQGDWVVFDAAVCTITLPEIESAYDVTSPEILAITSDIDAYAETGDRGCFLQEAATMFDTLAGGGRGDGFDAYIRFIGAGLIRGDLRFYGPSPLRTPPSFQVVSGACAEVGNINAIARSHDVLAEGFGGYVRKLGAETACDGSFGSATPMMFAGEMQGAAPDGTVPDDAEINAWLWFEFDLIAMAAGWHDGMTGTEKGTPRPPLCHH